MSQLSEWERALRYDEARERNASQALALANNDFPPGSNPEIDLVLERAAKYLAFLSNGCLKDPDGSQNHGAQTESPQGYRQ